jgi:hypothetical protein
MPLLVALEAFLVLPIFLIERFSFTLLGSIPSASTALLNK